YTAFMILPLFNSMRMSFYTGSGIVPDQFCGMQNYIKLFTQFPFRDRLFNAFFNNVKFFLMVSFFQNVAGFFIAVLLTRKIRGTKFYRTFFFIPTALSVIVVGFLFKLMLNPVWGIVDKILKSIGLGFIIRPWLGDPATALPVLSIVTAWHMIGIPLIFFTAGMDGIPEEVIEASRIDGINIWGEVRHILFPLIKPIIGIVFILTFVGNFSEFEIVYSMETVYGNPAFATDVFGSFFYRTTFGTVMNVISDVGLGATIATIMFIIILIGVIFFLRLSRREE
ncbi:MAG: sugar ABC transporter permease, partial [Actinobacteria bacterium]|nr:sugar ABC transporter permease [Actinomycetota bacterium]